MTNVEPHWLVPSSVSESVLCQQPTKTESSPRNMNKNKKEDMHDKVDGGMKTQNITV